LEIETLKQEQEELNKQKESEEQARIVAIKKANAVKIYHVKSGDTLSHIAKHHKVSVRQIKQWNNLKSDFLRIGQKLKIHTN
jgi:LysM repeat protein